MSQTTLDAFTRAYIICALWASTDNGGQPLDANYSIKDIAHNTLARMVSDCAKFQTAQASLITAGLIRKSDTYTENALAGHDFWLTRNGHGAGFWDGDWTEGDALTAACNAFGAVDLYVGDDDLIYQSGAE